MLTSLNQNPSQAILPQRNRDLCTASRFVSHSSDRCRSHHQLLTTIHRHYGTDGTNLCASICLFGSSYHRCTRCLLSQTWNDLQQRAVLAKLLTDVCCCFAALKRTQLVLPQDVQEIQQDQSQNCQLCLAAVTVGEGFLIGSGEIQDLVGQLV